MKVRSRTNNSTNTSKISTLSSSLFGESMGLATKSRPTYKNLESQPSWESKTVSSKDNQELEKLQHFSSHLSKYSKNLLMFSVSSWLQLGNWPIKLIMLPLSSINFLNSKSNHLSEELIPEMTEKLCKTEKLTLRSEHQVVFCKWSKKNGYKQTMSSS